MEVLEEELKEAKIAVHHLGGVIPADTVPERNAVLSEAQVSSPPTVAEIFLLICNARKIYCY